jgi:hypothetical protein
MTLKMLAPCSSADVTKPRRKECPEMIAGSSPAAAAQHFMISATPPDAPALPDRDKQRALDAAPNDVSAQRGREADEEDCPVSLPIKASGPCAYSTAIALALAGALPVAASHGSRLGRAGRHR